MHLPGNFVGFDLRFYMSPPSIVRTNTAELYDAYVMKNYARASLTLVRGQGVSVWDDAGREYLDFTSGVAVAAVSEGVWGLGSPSGPAG